MGFPIVGIGASAGGLEAFERFFTAMPPDSGLAFVIVQHLDPTHKSILTELVQKFTHMKVSEVTDGIALEPNHVYIIPPHHDMAILHGRLHLMEQVKNDRRLPIDFFFRSLAADQGSNAICIILSGTGTEGTLGLKAVKERDGMVMVQTPESAQYDGMPRSAAATGQADYILPPENMPEKLIAYARRMSATGVVPRVTPLPKSVPELQRIFVLLQVRTGHDFSLYKQNTILRRIERRMSINQMAAMADYVHFLAENPREVDILFRELLIEVTNFFRDPEAFRVLKEKVIPELFRDRPLELAVRVWVPGCSTGEEAYSIAMLLREYMDEHRHAHQLQVFASDIDQHAIETARQGIYPDSVAADLPSESYLRFFTREGNTLQVKKSVRDTVIFAVQSVIKDPPFSKMDLISCRNLLIYMKPELQKHVLRLFDYALKPNGFLFLGGSESMGEFTDEFAVVDRKWKIFHHSEHHAYPFGTRDTFTMGRIPLAEREQAAIRSRPVERVGLREMVEGTLLGEFTPAAVVIDARGDVLYFQGRTDKYLELPEGMARMNILSMAREGLRTELTTAVYQALVRKAEVRKENLLIRTHGEFQHVDLVIRSLENADSEQTLLLVVFKDRAEPEPVRTAGNGEAAAENPRVAELEKEVQSTREQLNATIEELEISNEELKSANEELQSTNEELQSTNEELETSKEELQSVNEELTTVNAELESKLEELSHTNDDLVNLLAATDIGTIFLDEDLAVLRFTPAAANFVNLISTDIGRPLSHLVTRFDDTNLVEDARKVLNTLVPREQEAHLADGRWCLIRTRPYRTRENVIVGVVIAMVDITEQKRIHAISQATEQAPAIVVITDPDGTIQYVNPYFSTVTGYAPDEALGRNIRLLHPEEDNADSFGKMWSTLLHGREWRGDVCSRKKNGELFWESLSISPVKGPGGKTTQFVSVSEENTALIEQLRSLKRLAAVVSDSNDAIMLLDFEGRIQAWNHGATLLYGWAEDEALRMSVFDTIPKSKRAEFRRLLQRIRDGEDIQSFVMPRLTREGKHLNMWLTITRLQDESGKPFGISTTERNVAEGGL